MIKSLVCILVFVFFFAGCTSDPFKKARSEFPTCIVVPYYEDPTKLVVTVRCGEQTPFQMTYLK